MQQMVQMAALYAYKKDKPIQDTSFTLAQSCYSDGQISNESLPTGWPCIDGVDSRCVHLFDMGKCQNHLAPVPASIVCMTWVSLEVNRLELFQSTQLRLEVVKMRNFVVGCPEFLKFGQMRNVFNLFNHIVANVKNSKFFLMFKE